MGRPFRVRHRSLQGVFLAMGAPLGWLSIRALAGHSPLDELAGNLGLYVYLTLPTAVAFAVFGSLIGSHEERLEQANKRLEKASVTDELTGLRNLRYFRARLIEEHARSQRTGAPFTIAIVDLDHFKLVNDRFGHQTGDRVLASSAHALASVSRRGDTAARVGGEEFALLLPETDKTEAIVLAERVRLAISKASVDNGKVAVTASVGVACSSDFSDPSADNLYANADRALYQAKEEGRNRVATADPSLQVESADIRHKGSGT